MGVNPCPFTLRELLSMAESRVEQEWNHTAALLALLANVHRDPKKGRMLSPKDFHPMPAASRPAPPRLRGDIHMLKAVFVDGALGNRP